MKFYQVTDHELDTLSTLGALGSIVIAVATFCAGAWLTLVLTPGDPADKVRIGFNGGLTWAFGVGALLSAVVAIALILMRRTKADEIKTATRFPDNV